MFIAMVMVMLVTMMMHSRPLSHEKYYFEYFSNNDNNDGDGDVGEDGDGSS